MENEIRIKIIERFDSYFSGINNKGSFLLAFNTFLIGVFFVGYNDLLGIIACYEKLIFNVLMGLIMTSSIISMIFTIIAIIPYLKSAKISNEKSNWFFNDIATEEKDLFIERINNTTSEQQILDLNNQIFELAKGLRKKHRLIKIALIINFIEVVLLVPVIYLILN